MKRHADAFLAGLTLLLGCSTTPVAGPKQADAGLGSDPYRITSFEVGRKLEGTVMSQRVFSRTDSVILAVRIEAAQAGHVLRVALRQAGTDRPVQDDSVQLTAGENSVQRLLWKARLGPNRVEVTVDGEPVATHAFEVLGADSPQPPDEWSEGPDVKPPNLKRPVGAADPPPDQTPHEDLRGLLAIRCLVTREGTAESCVVLRPVKGGNALGLSWLARQRWDPAMLHHVPVDVRNVFDFQFGPKDH
ncbi:MAG TPA: hypothetical protein VFI53_06835 [Myxococcaceae bacterium]|nr:hypothetical protein [Myxococcaceae bacterium]